MAETGRLIVVATPIGNLADLSSRAATILCQADVIACEDTRRTATLLRHVGSAAPMLSTHEHNERSRTGDLLERIRTGQTVVLVSDAGMPLISDPGARLVEAAIAVGIDVSVVPGPSAVETALVASGLPADAFCFVGFFPRSAQQRRDLFERLATFGGSVVGFESPRRIGALLVDLAALDAGRRVAVCRELTKVHEEILRGSAAELAERCADGLRGEVTVVIGPAAPSADADDAERVVAVLAGAGLGPKAIADVASQLGLAGRNAAYRAALAAARRSST